MKFDLHTHSHFSDGVHPPEFVLARASENGVSHLALTDHDCLDGYLHACHSRQDNSPELVPGVEISTVWENLEIHVVGLDFDPYDPVLSSFLKGQQEKRRERLDAMDLKLQKAGISGLGNYMQGLPCVSPGRAHVARYLASQSKNASTKKAFRALAKNGRFYVRPSWCTMSDAIHCIRAAGGIAVLAHPHRYPLNRRSLKKLLASFHDAGGEAMEVCCSNMSREILENLATLSLEHSLWVSAGSDFHTSDATWMDIGRLTGFPDSIKKNAVWAHPRWHFQKPLKSV